jgi:hypothetical protein
VYGVSDVIQIEMCTAETVPPGTSRNEVEIAIAIAKR